MRVSGSYESHRLHSSTQHARWQIHGGGSNTGEEAHDGFNAAWVACVPQSFQSDDHVRLIAIPQAFRGHVQQRLVQVLNKYSVCFFTNSYWLHYNLTYRSFQRKVTYSSVWLPEQHLQDKVYNRHSACTPESHRKAPQYATGRYWIYWRACSRTSVKERHFDLIWREALVESLHGIILWYEVFHFLTLAISTSSGTAWRWLIASTRVSRASLVDTSPAWNLISRNFRILASLTSTIMSKNQRLISEGRENG